MIQIQQVTHRIGQSIILNNINLTIKNGGITALVGWKIDIIVLNRSFRAFTAR